MTDILGSNPDPKDFVAANGVTVRKFEKCGHYPYVWRVTYRDKRVQVVTANGRVISDEHPHAYDLKRRSSNILEQVVRAITKNYER